MGKIVKLLWFTTKASVLGGSVYITCDQKVWGTPEDTRKLYSKIYEQNPWIKTYKEAYLDDFLPKDLGNINYRNYWNSGVLATFRFIADSPSKMVVLKNCLVESLSFMSRKSPKEIPKTTS